MGIRSTSMAGLRLAALFVIVAVVTCNVEDSTASYRLDDSMSAVMPLNEFVDMGEAVDPAAANSAANAAESEAATATDKVKNADSQANADQTKISDAKTEEDKLKAAKRKREAVDKNMSLEAHEKQQREAAANRDLTKA